VGGSAPLHERRVPGSEKVGVPWVVGPFAGTGQAWKDGGTRARDVTTVGDGARRGPATVTRLVTVAVGGLATVNTVW